MTQQQAQTIEQALARAAKENIKILGEGRFNLGERFWIVSAKNYATTNRAYIVKLVGEHLECNCRAQGICKHRAVVHQVLKTLKDERQPAETPASVPEQAITDFIEKLAAPMYETAATWEVERYKSHPDTLEFARLVIQERAAKREAALLVLCEMCQQEPATDFSEQPRCATCVRICQRQDERKAEIERAARIKAEREAATAERLARAKQMREAALLDTTPAFNGIYR